MNPTTHRLMSRHVDCFVEGTDVVHQDGAPAGRMRRIVNV